MGLSIARSLGTCSERKKEVAIAQVLALGGGKHQISSKVV
jgi:hypothetical protein